MLSASAVTGIAGVLKATGSESMASVAAAAAVVVVWSAVGDNCFVVALVRRLGHRFC